MILGKLFSARLLAMGLIGCGDSTTVNEASSVPPGPTPWIVAVSLDAEVTLPGGPTLARDEFHAWLWAEAEGLLGIDEGTVTAVDASARRLAPPGLVIDAAAAPTNRDWVAELAVADAEWWFADEASARAAASLVAGVRGCRVQGIRADEPIDHVAAARASFQPIAVPGFGAVRPAWEEGSPGVAGNCEATLFIEPGLGFGTGLHETTQLCLAAVAARRRRGGRLDRVLDYGSGSGILGIAAAVLGAGHVDAVEIDTNVHDALRENARRNGIADRLQLTAFLPPTPTPYDLVVANIVAAVLIEHATPLCDRVSACGGELVLSGLRDEEAAAVADRFAALLDSRPRIQERGVWRCLSFCRE
jgi:ribosomal protein L11 methyltransferase